MSWDSAEMVKIVWDYGEIVAKLTYGAPQATKDESTSNVLQMQKLRCILLIWTVFCYQVTRLLLYINGCLYV